MTISIKKASSGFGWIVLTNTLNRLFGFGTTLILAKILAPEHFGLVAAAETMVAILKVFRDFGIGQALIQTSRNDAITHDTAFVMMIVLSPILFFFAWLMSPYMADFLESPDLTPILIIMSTNIMALTTRSVPDALIRKEVEFQKFVIPDVISVLAAAAVGIYLALNDYGVWSLVIRTLIFYWLGTAMIWYVSGYRPSFRFNRKIALELFHYSKFVVGATILLMATTNIDRIFISKMEGMVALGVYTLAFGLASIPVSEFGHLICRIVFPVFSKVKDNLVELRKFLLYAVRLEGLITIPMAVGLMVYGPLLVDLVFEEKWIGLGAALRILAITALFRSFSIIFHEAFRAIGKPKLVQQIIAVRLAILLIFSYPSLLFAGLDGFCWMLTISASITLMAELYFIKKITRVRLFDVFNMTLYPILISLCSILPSYYLLNIISEDPNILYTTLAVMFTAATYFLIMSLLLRKYIIQLLHEIKSS